MYLKDFTYHKPQNLEEACKILEQSKNGAVIAGGTDILVEIKKGLRYNDNIISLMAIEELRVIDEDTDALHIGSGVTHNEVKNSSLIIKKFPAIVEAASKIGTDQIRNTGTIGGNLCTGASCCDMAPVLISHNASVEISSSTKQRIVSVKDFFIFHKKTSLKRGEIMTKIIVPKVNSSTGYCFEKFGLREAASISVASLSVMIKVVNNNCADSCVVIGAVAPTPKISIKASEVLYGIDISKLSKNSSVLRKAGEAAEADSLPLDDIRGTAYFRRNTVKVLAQRAILKAVIRASNLKI
ncbi:MAG: FAD binding domain-containing protein [Ignavibacterium sp.]|nr:MAG: FAD binding domain-containing protein [Ignavibacterium sp.]